jgi:hypothetical protein
VFEAVKYTTTIKNRGFISNEATIFYEFYCYWKQENSVWDIFKRLWNKIKNAGNNK